MILQRLATLLTTIWAGIMIGVGYIFTPILFNMLENEKQFAGQIAGHAFTAIAYLSLALGVVVMLIIRRQNKSMPMASSPTTLLLIIFIVGTAAINQFAITPELVLAKTGVSTPLSFSTLHIFSQFLYAAQVIMLIALGWFLSKPLKNNPVAPQSINNKE